MAVGTEALQPIQPSQPSRMVDVPQGCKAIFVSEQLLAHYEEWVSLALEARVIPTDNELVVDVQVRTTPSSARAQHMMGALIEDGDEDD